MICPSCSAPLAAQPDSSGLLVCASCGARLKARPLRPPQPAAAAPAPPASAPVASSHPPQAPLGPRPATTLDTLLGEIRAVRRAQLEILGLLKGRGESPASDALDADLALGPPEEVSAAGPPPLRARRRKTVLLIDDDESTRQAALAALTQVEVPTRAFADGSGAVSAIAAEKPDVIVLELGLTGSMAGRDLINVIKSTMEWVDIKIVLYTREPVASQKEARQVHGADEVVSKGPGSATVLVQRVISVFRRG